MVTAALILISVLLLLLNVFFVLCEFAMVKIRGSKVDEMVEGGLANALAVKHVHERLDQYLAVCQVGITFASVALGFIGEPLAHNLIQPLIERLGVTSLAWQHGIVVVVGVGLISFLHVVLGEQVPKMVAINRPENVARWTAPPLRFFRVLFWAPLWILNLSTRGILRLLGLSGMELSDEHSEDELRIILDRSQSRGLLSFRRLLFLENVFDLGELKVKDAMRPRGAVRMLNVGLHWLDQAQFIRTWRYSRFPLIGDDSERPLGVVHIKDIAHTLLAGQGEPELVKLARPYIVTSEQTALESLLAEMQRRHIHVALVYAGDKSVGERKRTDDGTGAGSDRWTGLITMEDIIEEVIGTVEDEFADEPTTSLADVLTPARVVLGVDAPSLAAAARLALLRVPAQELPMPAETLIKAVLDRERQAASYLGRGIAMPHARMPGLDKPVLIIARSDAGIPVEGSVERARLLFILLTPAGQPRIHQRLQARIAGIIEESDFVEERLLSATSAGEILEVVRAGEQAALG